MLHSEFRRGLDISRTNERKSSTALKPDGLLQYKPAFTRCLRGYNLDSLKRDFGAGFNVAIVALPLSMALAIAVGAPPQAGLFTSIMAGIAAALFGGSRVQISGPTAAFVVILAPIFAQRGLPGLMFAGMFAGLMLILMGLIRFGALIKYIPYPVTAGYNTGIATIIATLQLKEILGLQVGYERMQKLGDPAQIVHDGKLGEFVEITKAYVHALPDSYWGKLDAIYHGLKTTPVPQVAHSACAGLVSLAALLLYPRWFPRIARRVPAPLVAILLGVAANFVFIHYLNWREVPTVGARYGAFERALPAFNMDFLTHFNWRVANVASYVMPAFSIAILCAVASLLSAVVADGIAGTKHDSNTELIGQGIGNIVSPFFGGIAVSGAVARTIVNVRHGAGSPFAAIIHSVILLVLILIFGPYAGYIPMPSLAAILLVVAYHMADVRSLKNLLRAPLSDVVVLFACLLLTVFVDMSAAISVGMILAALLFMRRMSELTSIDSQITGSDAEMQSHDLEVHDVPRSVIIYSVDGPFFFGAAEKAFEAIGDLRDNTRIVVLRLNRVPAMDATGLFALVKVYENLKAHGVALILSGLRPQPRDVMKKAGFLETVGYENIKPDIEWALVRCYELLGEEARNTRSGKTTIIPKLK